MIWLTVPLMALLNHIRGGGGLFGQRISGWLDRLPGNGDMHAAPLVGLLAWWCGVSFVWYPLPGWISAVIFALGWLAWSTPAWGFLQGLGRGPGPTEVRAPSWYEVLFLRTGDPWLAYGLRTTLFLIPLAAACGWYWILLGPLQVGAYELGWRLRQPGIALGELFTGALWGALMVAQHLL